MTDEQITLTIDNLEIKWRRYSKAGFIYLEEEVGLPSFVVNGKLSCAKARVEDCQNCLIRLSTGETPQQCNVNHQVMKQFSGVDDEQVLFNVASWLWDVLKSENVRL